MIVISAPKWGTLFLGSSGYSMYANSHTCTRSSFPHYMIPSHSLIFFTHLLDSLDVTNGQSHPLYSSPPVHLSRVTWILQILVRQSQDNLWMSHSIISTSRFRSMHVSYGGHFTGIHKHPKSKALTQAVRRAEIPVAPTWVYVAAPERS